MDGKLEKPGRDVKRGRWRWIRVALGVTGSLALLLGGFVAGFGWLATVAEAERLDEEIELAQRRRAQLRVIAEQTELFQRRRARLRERRALLARLESECQPLRPWLRSLVEESTEDVRLERLRPKPGRVEVLARVGAAGELDEWLAAVGSAPGIVSARALGWPDPESAGGRLLEVGVARPEPSLVEAVLGEVGDP